MPDTSSEAPTSRHRIITILSAHTSALEKNAQIMSALAKSTASIDHQLAALLRALSGFHGQRDAFEVEETKDRKRKDATLEAILHQMRKIGTRVTELEAEVEVLRIHAATRDDGDKGGGRNGPS